MGLFEKIGADMHAMVRNANYAAGSIDFDAIQNIATNKAERANETMDATLYLDLLLAESTVAVRRHIFGDMSVGEMEEPEGITYEVPNPNSIIVKGADKQQVGQMAAQIREKRPPEPYHGKGVKYVDEVIRRKAGKTGK